MQGGLGIGRLIQRSIVVNNALNALLPNPSGSSRGFGFIPNIPALISLGGHLNLTTLSLLATKLNGRVYALLVVMNRGDVSTTVGGRINFITTS